MAQALPDRRPGPLIRAGDQLAPRWIAPIFLGMSLLLLPWIVYLSVSLPTHAIARHYNLSWVGFDVLLFFSMSRTAWLAFQGRRQVELPAVTTAVLLVVDAWFDVTTADAGWPLVQAIVLAVCVELPAAALSMYIARRVERIERARGTDS